jgi:excisionase family DNA binding protein
MQSRTESRLVTVQEAAKFLALSKSTLYGWVYQRRIPFVKVGSALRFELAELEKFVQSNRFQARA